MDQAPNINDQKERKLELHNNLHTKLMSLMEETQRLDNKLDRLKDDPWIFTTKVAGENEIETKRIRINYDREIIDTQRRLLNLSVEHNGMKEDLESWRTKIDDFTSPDSDISLEELDKNIAFLNKSIEMIEHYNEHTSEMISLNNILSRICDVVLKQSNSFQMKKNILKTVSTQLNKYFTPPRMF